MKEEYSFDGCISPQAEHLKEAEVDALYEFYGWVGDRIPERFYNIRRALEERGIPNREGVERLEKIGSLLDELNWRVVSIINALNEKDLVWDPEERR